MVATVEVRATQADVLAAATFISTAAYSTQASVLTASTFLTPNTNTTQAAAIVATTPLDNLRVTQAEVLVAILIGGGVNTLRAWTFTQDDHDFYVLQLGASTYIYDKKTEQWCQWKSPSLNYWDGVDGCDWMGINVCCSATTGDIYKIDADNRLDYATTPIVSTVYGGMTERFRDFVPCYMAEVAISQAKPPLGAATGSVGIQLRTFDTVNWVDHGTVAGAAYGTPTTVRFYGLGLMHPPGVVFEITDTGYARRIDGLNIETTGHAGG